MGVFKSFVLQPKEGRGIITSRSPQNLNEYTDSVNFLENFLVKDGAWRIRPSETTGSVGGSSGAVYGIHFYNAIDPTAPEARPVTVILEHAGQLTDETGTSTLRRSDTGGVVTVNGVNFTTTTPSDIFFLNIKNRCFVAGTKMGAGVVPTIVTKYPSAASYMWGINAPTNEMTYDAYTNATNATTKVYFTTLGAHATNLSPNVTKIAGANWDTAWAGKTVQLNGVNYGIVSVTGTGGPMTLDRNYEGSTADVNIRVQYGEIGWPDRGPQYAYAYYNPTTGHISKISPILQISETGISNVRVNLSNIQLTNDANYTRVVLFRKAFDNGGLLLPLKLDPAHGGSASITSDFMINNNAVGTVTYVDFRADFPFVGGILGGIVAPTENNPPPADVRYMAYWDQRIWVVSAAVRSRLQYSGNSAQIQFGVAEESFPALNFLDVPADDGFIVGLKTVGTSLLVCTERYLYFVDASTGTYRLVRISSRGSGVDQYAIDGHPGDSSEQSASALYVSRDKRLWRQYPAGRIEDMGWPIQDKLDTIDLGQKKPVTIKVAQVGKNWLLVLGIRQQTWSGTPRYNYLFYDFDEQSWIDLGLGGANGLWGSGYAGYSVGFWSGVASGVVYNSNSGISTLAIGSDGAAGWQRLNIMADTANAFGGYFVGNSQDLDCGDKQLKKTFQELLIHTDIPASSFTVAMSFDGTTGTSGIYYLQPVANSTTATSPRYMGNQVLRYVFPSTPITSGGFGPGASPAPTTFHTARILWQVLGGTLNAGVFKIVMNYTVESTGVSGSAT